MNRNHAFPRWMLGLGLVCAGGSLFAMMPVTHCGGCVIRETYTSGSGTTWDGCGHSFSTEGAADQWVLLHCGD